MSVSHMPVIGQNLTSLLLELPGQGYGGRWQGGAGGLDGGGGEERKQEKEGRREGGRKMAE